MKILKIFFAIVLLTLIFTNNYTYASFADYTDEDAEIDTQKMIQEHENNFDSTKSENNYLKELTVKGFAISPNFDRQFTDYTVKVDANTKEIDIIAIPEDNKATVNGIGEIDISNTSECKIEVIAESGTTRTYFIKISKENETIGNSDETSKDAVINNEVNDIEIISKNYNTINENTTNNLQNNNKKNILTGIGITGGIIILIIFIILKNR